MRFYLTIFCFFFTIVLALPNGTHAQAIITEQTLWQQSQGAAAHWLTPSLIKLSPKLTGQQVKLVWFEQDNLHQLRLSAIERDNSTDNKNTTQWPHLANFQRYQVSLSSETIKQLLKKPLWLIGEANSEILWVTAVQTANLLDYLYTKTPQDADEINDYGATVKQNITQFKIWAPTAQHVNIRLYDQQFQPVSAAIALTEDHKTGAWLIQIPKNLSGYYYRYQLTLFHPAAKKIITTQVTDPYSLSLSTNSQYSQIVDLSSQETKPTGWDEQTITRLQAPEDNIIYEVHIGDFSANEQHLTDKSNRGKYGAFLETNSDGIKQLKKLQHSGVTTIHLLPTFDIGTVNELEQQRLSLHDNIKKLCQLLPKHAICQNAINKNTTIEQILTSFDPTSAQAQQLIDSIRSIDDYNWGYDPYHYTVPEGSYAKNPEGIARIIEFRSMIQRLHQLGFRVVMDVVYNHTHQAHLQPQSVLDRIVPNYYQRLNPETGNIEQSTCCDNTATEHRMMAKLMIDSLVVWAREYKIDGFRFDLMGHQPKSVMLAARVAVQAVDDDTYFYGEGWNFGEVVNNQRFIQASQLNLAGSEIGTYSDRLRDAVRGAFMNLTATETRAAQGIGNGLLDNLNELNQSRDITNLAKRYLQQIKIGLAGNLAQYSLPLNNGQTMLGRDIDYNGQPTGYALDPADTINYVSKHDNHTLWDNHQLRLPTQTSTEDRVRYHVQSLAYTLLAQGIPFFQMGSELLRSKSFLHDSYDYGHWFNKVDYSGQHNNYQVGLPPIEKDGDKWQLIQQLWQQNQQRDKVLPQHITWANESVNELIKIRQSSRLFRLTTAEQILQQLHFLATDPVIGMQIQDDYNQPIDQHFEEIIVLFNATTKSQQISITNATQYQLHPVQRTSVDERLKTIKFYPNKIQLPALTTAVLVKAREDK